MSPTAVAHTLPLVDIVAIATVLIFQRQEKIKGWSLLLLLLLVPAVLFEFQPLTGSDKRDFVCFVTVAFIAGVLLCSGASFLKRSEGERDDLLSFGIAFAAAALALHLPPLEPPAVALQALAPLVMYVVTKHVLARPVSPGPRADGPDAPPGGFPVPSADRAPAGTAHIHQS